MDKLAEILKKIEDDYSVTEDQRIAANEDMRFVDVDGGMWEGWLSDQFSSRPKFESNKLAQSVYRYLGEWSLSRFQVNYIPTEESDIDAELLNNLYRRDFNYSNGQAAVDNAVSEQGKCGVGAYRLTTEYINPESPDDQRQRIVFEPIYTAFNTVIWDSNAKSASKSDAKHCTILTEYTKDAFEKEWPDVDIDTIPSIRDKRRLNWHNNDTVYVAEFYEIKKKKEVSFIYEDSNTGERKSFLKSEIVDVIDDLADRGFVKVGQKRLNRQVVNKTILTGSKIIEEERQIVGKNIPIVPIYGYRGYVDGQEFYYGLVRKRKDENRLLNMELSTIAETAATSPKRVPIVAPEQVEGLQKYWDEAHLGKYNYMPLNPLTDESGMVVQTDVQGYLEPPTIDQNAATLIDYALNSIREETGGNPQDVIDPKSSGKAINAVINRVDMQNQVLMDNIALSLVQGGKIYKDMAKVIYADARTHTVVAEDGSEATVKTSQSILDKETGQVKIINDLSAADWEVKVTTGASFASRRRETTDTLKDLYKISGEDYQEFIFASIIENLDGVGISELKEHNKRLMLLKGLRQPDNEEEIKLVEELRVKQTELDPNEKLIEAAAQKEMAEARNLEAATLEKESKVVVNKATAAEKIAKIDREDMRENISLIKTLTAPATVSRRLI